jgi:hypothetical protein
MCRRGFADHAARDFRADTRQLDVLISNTEIPKCLH